MGPKSKFQAWDVILSGDKFMNLMITRSFPPSIGGMQNLMWGLANELAKIDILKVFADFELNQNGPIKLKVELVELIGANTLIHGKLENSNEILVASISGVVKEDTIGKNINLSIQNDNLHLFDTNTDLRIN